MTGNGKDDLGVPEEERSSSADQPGAPDSRTSRQPARRQASRQPARRQAPGTKIAAERIQDSLAAGPVDVVRRVHENALRVFDIEQKAYAAVEAKGGSLLATVGATLSVLFGLGGKLVVETNHRLLEVLFAAATILLVIAALVCTIGIRLRKDVPTIDEENLLPEALLVDADEEQPYLAFVSVHLHDVTKRLYAVRQARGHVLVWAQRLYMLAVAVVAAAALTLLAI
jgi:hypothetical protein